jgi:D-alanine-D-alanine ligase
MQTKKIRVGVLFGGKSTEHEVSIASARNIVKGLDKDKYEVVLLGIDKKGNWHLNNAYQMLLENQSKEKMKDEVQEGFGEEVFIVPNNEDNGKLISLTDVGEVKTIDVFFPMLHGSFGEDGTMQGMLKLLNVPYVGVDVLGAAVGMDKVVMKKLFIADGIPTCDYVCIQPHTRHEFDYEALVERLKLPMFVKPANAGSSVGVSKVRNKAEFEAALDDAFLYDNKLLVEECIVGREVECAVLGNENPKASILGEIIPTHDFYSYEAKYIDENGARVAIPANVDEATSDKIRALAIKVFKTLCHEGMGRVDCFLTDAGEIYVNEINSIPGFTNISMYPQLWAATGLPQAELLDELIELAIARFKRDQRLQSLGMPIE